ncbi:hypothetical protein BHE74_00046517 [Ensete ventricosum]|uniref:Uncharacterized protein n=1 Tax=Ensete ventricosum TaxID=4639 RepID=A0A445MGA1_ENSVE|nr:hypothetical protein BHE74_00046517 [Ensete ventricosum]RZR73294.1 hypothetical protein BHM03_00022484 [Ensete ventricosum]
MERYDLAIASTRVHGKLGHFIKFHPSCSAPRFALRFPLCGLGTLSSFTQVAPLLGLY